MPAPKDLDKSGTYLLIFFFSIFCALLGHLKGAMCGTWHCSYVFWGISVLALIGVIRRIFFA